MESFLAKEGFEDAAAFLRDELGKKYKFSECDLSNGVLTESRVRPLFTRRVRKFSSANPMLAEQILGEMETACAMAMARAAKAPHAVPPTGSTEAVMTDPFAIHAAESGATLDLRRLRPAWSDGADGLWPIDKFTDAMLAEKLSEMGDSDVASVLLDGCSLDNSSLADVVRIVREVYERQDRRAVAIIDLSDNRILGSIDAERKLVTELCGMARFVSIAHNPMASSSDRVSDFFLTAAYQTLSVMRRLVWIPASDAVKTHHSWRQMLERGVGELAITPDALRVVQETHEACFSFTRSG
jgi:hypothetical protein